jgi:hypothetical protein
VNLTVGHVRIQGEPRADAVIEITRIAPTAEGLMRIPVGLDETDTEVRVTGLQADGGTDPSYRTDLILRVPRAATLAAVRIMEGRLTLTSFEGHINADVRRGPIEATDVEGTIRLETGIGEVVANRVRLSAGGLLRFRTFNGNVRVTFAERPVDARILALALNGTIHSDIPLQMKDTWGPRFGEATLGRGEPVISIDVVTGRIEIRAP